MNFRIIILGIAIVVAAFIGATLLMNLLWPSSLQEGRPQLVAVPPLPPLAGTSTVLAPAAIAMSAIRDALEAEAPRNLSGASAKSGVAIAASGRAQFHHRARAARRHRAARCLGGEHRAQRHLPGARHAHRRRRRSRQHARQHARRQSWPAGAGARRQGLRSARRLSRHRHRRRRARASRPNWRLAPNLTAQVNVVDVVLPIAGVKLSVSNEVRPLLDNMVREQTGALESRVRNDPFIENAARAEWIKLCRAISLGAAGQGVPDLWLEIRPMRAIAAQPKIDANAVTLLVGVQAETRIVPNETKPNCPFPTQLDIVPQANEGTLDIAVPIDIPFPEVSRLIEAQVKGKTFPEDGSGSVRHHDQTGRRGRLRRPVVDFAAGEREEGTASSRSAPTPPCMSGASRCSIRTRRSCASPTWRSTCNPRPRSGCWAKPRRRPCLICKRRSPSRRSSTSSRLPRMPRSAWRRPPPNSPGGPRRHRQRHRQRTALARHRLRRQESARRRRRQGQRERRDFVAGLAVKKISAPA